MASIPRKKKAGRVFITTQVPAEIKSELKEIYTNKGWLSEGEFMRSVIRQVVKQYRQTKENPAAG